MKLIVELHIEANVKAVKPQIGGYHEPHQKLNS